MRFDEFDVLGSDALVSDRLEPFAEYGSSSISHRYPTEVLMSSPGISNTYPSWPSGGAKHTCVHEGMPRMSSFLDGSVLKAGQLALPGAPTKKGSLQSTSHVPPGSTAPHRPASYLQVSRLMPVPSGAQATSGSQPESTVSPTAQPRPESRLHEASAEPM